VPKSNIHDARIRLASMGLPKGVSAGFDALSSLSNVKNARVHLAVPRQSVFVRNRKKSSASVVIDLFPGRNLESGQVSAITHMVSSSIPELDVSNVTVVDQPDGSPV